MDGIIFDMDGVLVDTEEFYLTRRLEFLKEEGIEPATMNIFDFVGETNNGIWKKLVPQDNTLRKRLSKKYDKYREEHPTDYRTLLIPGVEEVFKELRLNKKKVAIASSSPLKEINNMIAQNQFQNYIDFVISGEDLNESKPNPEIYLKTVSGLGQGEYIAVEDSTLGIRAAKDAGLFTLALKSRFVTDQSYADQQIETLHEILNYM
ncbi:HAD family hydrolase [Streptococcus pluranimalium]|uniref:HAD family hydrolase n=1 Tax=Streptococcus pluranimalium TaxID=82348 RepID=UPI003BF892BC